MIGLLMLTEKQRSRLLWMGLALALLAALPAAIYLHRAIHAYRNPPASYEPQREKFVLVQSGLIGKVDTLIVGDSITESNILDGLCGRTFAAGIGAATIADVSRLLPVLIHNAQPRVLIIAIGTNDILGHKPIRDSYAAMIRGLPMRPAVLVGVHGTDNGIIARQAASVGAAYVPPLDPGLTWDGMHPTVEGARVWRARLKEHCPLRG